MLLGNGGWGGILHNVRGELSGFRSNSQLTCWKIKFILTESFIVRLFKTPGKQMHDPCACDVKCVKVHLDLMSPNKGDKVLLKVLAVERDLMATNTFLP